MIVKILASGSKGNSSYYENANTKILIDLGISYKRVSNALANENFDVSEVNAVFITHEHGDHVSGIYTFLKRSTAKIYMTKGTYNALCDKRRGDEIFEAKKRDQIRIIKMDYTTNKYDKVSLENLVVSPMQSFHDASEPCNYILNSDEKKVCLITDTGYIHRKQIDDFMGADCYILESNHDPNILMNSDRPYPLKQRILSTTGHLSNEDSMYILTKLVRDNTKTVYYAHISDDCNLFEVVEETRKNVFKELNISTEGIEFIFTGQFICEAKII